MKTFTGADKSTGLTLIIYYYSLFIFIVVLETSTDFHMANSVVICFTVYAQAKKAKITPKRPNSNNLCRENNRRTENNRRWLPEGAEGGARFSRGVQFMGVRRGLSGHGLVSIPNPYQLLETEYPG